MGSHKNVIEINGKLYDATSGTLISQQTIRPTQSTKTVDGFVRSTPKAIKSSPASPMKITLAPKPVKHRDSAANIKHRTPQKSHTLMRSAVKKPTATKSPQIHSIAKKSSPDVRVTRAQSVSKSAFINKFGSLSHHQPVTRRTEVLAVKEPPKVHHTEPKPTTPVTQAPKATHKQTVSKSEELFNKALQNAPTEKKRVKHHAKKSHLTSRTTKWGTGIAAALLLIGFITYMNLPNLNMQLASARAGFDASMPGYKPSGFKVAGPVSYKAGQVTVAFSSNTDQRNYKVTQAVSNWNSEALQENFLNARSKNFQTAQESGKTIYMYDGGNATWVNGGVWYQVESNQALSSDQLLKIASSL